MIGPVFFTLLQTSVVKGFRAAVAFDLGVVFSDLLYILLAYFSSYQLLENPSNQPGIYVLGGTLLTIYEIIFLVGVNNSNRSKFRRRTKTLFCVFHHFTCSLFHYRCFKNITFETPSKETDPSNLF